MNLGNFSRRSSPDASAAGWLARRDRGLSPREQDEYLQWLRENERHAAAIARAEATLRRVLQLSAWRHEHGAEPNPDLLARPQRQQKWLLPATVAVVAAVAVWLGHGWRSPAIAPVLAQKLYLRVNERVALPDGSHAELRDGSQLEIRYSAAERRVRLTGGEAQFSVMKDSARPFIVEAADIAVRAIGTVFTVQLGRESVAVLVTEGKVRVGAAVPPSGKDSSAPAANEPAFVAAGQRAVVPLGAARAKPVVTDVSAEDIRCALDWQAPRLQFDETPLAEAIKEFNRRNVHQLVLGDATLGAVPIGGTFRPDNVDAFVRLLAITVGVRAESRGPNETVLFQRP